MDDLIEIASLVEKQSKVSEKRKALISKIIANTRRISTMVLDAYDERSTLLYSDEQLEEYARQLEAIIQKMNESLRKDNERRKKYSARDER